MLEKASCCWERAAALLPSAFALGCGKVCTDNVDLGKGLSRGEEPCRALRMGCVMQGRARDGAQISEFLYWDSSIESCHLLQVILHLPLQSWASQGRNNCRLHPWEKRLLVGARQLRVAKGRNRSPGCPFKRVLSARVSSTRLPCIQAGCSLAWYFAVVLWSGPFCASADLLRA